jgi:uracil-DNA glycosylase
MNVEGFVSELTRLTFENTFNPYSDRCEVYDYFDAPKKRRVLLRKMLIAANQVDVDAIWIGRDLGYRGGRRTGLALTDDVNLRHHANRWDVDCDQMTKGTAVPERTAAVIWSVLAQIASPIFLWNVFPLHPFEAGSPFSNRAHNSKERKAGEELLAILIDLLKPKRLIAIGNDAESVALRFGDSYTVSKVRHPSYGGQKIFLEQIKSLYNIDTIVSSNMNLVEAAH